MASGLALVAYDYAAARQYLSHGTSGLLAATGDRSAFVRLSEQLARDAALRGRLRSEARRVAEAASWSRAFDDLERVLRTLVAADPPKLDPVRPETVHVET